MSIHSDTINKINKAFETNLEPAMLFECPTVGLLSDLIRAEKPNLAASATGGDSADRDRLESYRTFAWENRFVPDVAGAARAGTACSTTSTGRMKTPMARSSLVISV